jgi:hypothetical protein
MRKFFGLLAMVCVACSSGENYNSISRGSSSTTSISSSLRDKSEPHSWRTPRAVTSNDISQFVRSKVEGVPEGDISYKYALSDLNNDRNNEAIILVIGRQVCGSGGCPMYVLSPTASAPRLIGTTTIVNAPVKVLRKESSGWRHLSVRVKGGGVEQPYQAELPFIGTAYASNPSVTPARPVNGNGGELLISDESSRIYRLRNRESR